MCFSLKHYQHQQITLEQSGIRVGTFFEEFEDLYLRAAKIVILQTSHQFFVTFCGFLKFVWFKSLITCIDNHVAIWVTICDTIFIQLHTWIKSLCVFPITNQSLFSVFLGVRCCQHLQCNVIWLNPNFSRCEFAKPFPIEGLTLFEKMAVTI